MQSRIWWKESRQFLPIWVFLALGAFGVQELANRFGPMVWNFEQGWTPMTLALGWTTLYALVVGAAAFAGERETKTLAFLDAVPVPRSVLWNGKASFGLVSTAGVGAMLVGIAGLTPWLHPELQAGSIEQSLEFAPLPLAALAWGLVCSSFTGTALIAAFCAIGCMSFDIGLARVSSEVVNHIQGTGAPSGHWSPELVRTAVVVVVLLLISRSKIAGASLRLPSPSAPAAETKSVQVLKAGGIQSFEPMLTTRRLFWQAWRSQSSEWLLALAIVAGGVAEWSLTSQSLDPWECFGLIATLASVLVGVSVFSKDNSAGTYRFLANHGVAPNRAWSGRIVPGLFKIVLVNLVLFIASRYWTLPSTVAFPQVTERFDYTRNEADLLSVFIALVSLHAFSVSQVVSQSVRRSITACVVSIVLSIATFVPMLALVWFRLVPEYALGLVPLVMLVGSLAGMRGWMLEGPGGKRLVVPFGVVAAATAVGAGGYIAYRTLDVPNGSFFVDSETITAFGPKEQAAARDLEILVSQLQAPTGDRKSSESWEDLSTVLDPTKGFAKRLWAANQALLPRIIEQARRNEAPLISPITRSTVAPNPAWLMKLTDFAAILGREAYEKIDNGKLPEAWTSIDALLRLGRRMSVAATNEQLVEAEQVLLLGDVLAIKWCSNYQITKELIDRAGRILVRCRWAGRSSRRSTSNG